MLPIMGIMDRTLLWLLNRLWNCVTSSWFNKCFMLDHLSMTILRTCVRQMLLAAQRDFVMQQKYLFLLTALVHYSETDGVSKS